MKKISKKAEEMTVKELASYIDYSVLKPEFTEEQIIELTKDGVKLGCATICINPGYIELCTPYVEGTETGLCPVTDFPFGTSSTESKTAQVEIAAGYDTVTEIDVVANFGLIRSGEYEKVTADLKACADTAHKYGKELKVIFETDALTEEQIKKTCRCCMEAGADFVKTSTGFSTGGATIEDIELMREAVGPIMGVKASGGARTLEAAKAFIKAGATRIGTSSGVAIMKGQ